MEPSRDDFVIAIRSAFLKKGTKQRFSLIVLLFFSVGLIVLGKFNFFALNYLKIILFSFFYFKQNQINRLGIAKIRLGYIEN